MIAWYIIKACLLSQAAATIGCNSRGNQGEKLSQAATKVACDSRGNGTEKLSQAATSVACNSRGYGTEKLTTSWKCLQALPYLHAPFWWKKHMWGISDSCISLFHISS